ncbi:MAG: hypothetical protein AAF693_19650 [Bacteroidota bacterium]
MELCIALLFSLGSNNGDCPATLHGQGRRCGSTRAVATGEEKRPERSTWRENSQ